MIRPRELFDERMQKLGASVDEFNRVTMRLRAVKRWEDARPDDAKTMSYDGWREYILIRILSEAQAASESYLDLKE